MGWLIRSLWGLVEAFPVVLQDCNTRPASCTCRVCTVGVRVYRSANYSRTQKSWNMAVGGFVLGSLILYLKGMRTTMFQLSGFYCRVRIVCSLRPGVWVLPPFANTCFSHGPYLKLPNPHLFVGSSYKP